ncbi:SGNH/GDSL hydrolase family protein, partial [Micromonospora azadirachtae]
MPPYVAADTLAGVMWHRYVAIGDSTTEGLDDPDGSGGYRGWADRFALAVARSQGRLEYANLAIRGRTTARIRAEQLPVALGLAPDLATVVAGMNDILRPSFDVDRVAEDVGAMQQALVEQGATVLTFTLPDPAPVMPVARPLRGRVSALNEALRKVTASTGATLLDLGVHPVASDPRLWSDDRLHANS